MAGSSPAMTRGGNSGSGVSSSPLWRGSMPCSTLAWILGTSPRMTIEGLACSSLHLPLRLTLAGIGILVVLKLNALLQKLVADAVGLGPVLFGNEGEAILD